MANNSLQAVLKERRKARGLTLRQLSAESGISVAHLARIERKERFPSGHILRKLAVPLDFSEVELLKLAGYLSRDDSGKRLSAFKREIKAEILDTMVTLYRKVDTL